MEMIALREAYQSKDMDQFERILRSPGSYTAKDPFVYEYVHSVPIAPH